MEIDSDDVVTVTMRAAGPPAAVWRALVDERESWWPELEFQPTTGSPLHETWVVGDQQFVADGVITAVQPEARLEFEWRDPGWNVSLTVAISLMRVGEGTRITLTESGFVQLSRAASIRDDHEAGWRHHLANLCRAAE